MGPEVNEDEMRHADATPTDLPTEINAPTTLHPPSVPQGPAMSQQHV